MLEFQAYTWLSYLFYELKVMLCCVYTREKYFPLFSLLIQCEGVLSFDGTLYGEMAQWLTSIILILLILLA